MGRCWVTQNLTYPSTSRYLPWGSSTFFKPFMECTEFYCVLDGCISRQHADCKVLADVFNPTALANRTEPERDRFIEAFGSDFGTVIDSFSISDSYAACAERHNGRVAYSLYIRYAPWR